MVLSGVNANVKAVLEHVGIDKLIGKDHICSHITIAVRMANKMVATLNSPVADVQLQ